MDALLDAIARCQPGPEAARLFHGRGGLHPGSAHWSLDWYPPVVLATSHAPVADEDLARLGDALATRWQQLQPAQPLNWVFQQRDEVRAHNRLMAGSVPDPHTVAEHGARYAVHLMRGLNHGLFLDMAEGRRWVQAWAQAQPRPGGRVLNLFAYTCAFSVAALRGGAARVTNVDMAAGALAIGKRNHALNGVAAGAGFLPHDCFSSWGRIGRDGPYDLVIADPPAYQKGSFVADKDWPRLLRRLPTLLAPGGHALLCLNAPRWSEDWLREQLAREAPQLPVRERLANPAGFEDADPQRALKVLLAGPLPATAVPMAGDTSA